MNAGPSGIAVGTACYLFASVFWGLNIPLTAALLQSFDIFWLTLCRYAVAASLLGVLVASAFGPRRLHSPIPLARVAVLGLFVSGFLVAFTGGLKLTDPVTAAAVIAGSPVYVALVARLLVRAPLAPGFRGATLLTLVGAGIAISGRADFGGTGLRWQGGELLLVGSMASWTAYSIYAQRWFAADVPQLRRTWLSSAAALPWLVSCWLLARAAGLAGEPNLAPDPRDLAYLLITAILSTALSTVAWNIGVARLGIAVGGMWQNTVPVFAVLISAVFFGVVPSGAQVLGAGVVLAGVLWMQWHTFRAAPRTFASRV